MKQKTLTLLLSVTTALILAACSATTGASSSTSSAEPAAGEPEASSSQAPAADAAQLSAPEAGTPAAAVATAFDALKAGDGKTFQTLIETQEDTFYRNNTIFSDNMDQPDEAFFVALFADLSYQIGEAQVNGSTATVPVKLTTVDLSGVLGDIAQSALNGDEVDDNALLEAIKAAQGTTTEYELDIALVEKDGAWLIKLDTQLFNALTGNILSGIGDAVNAAVEEFTNQFGTVKDALDEAFSQ